VSERGEVYLEVTILGAYAKVVAIDATTGVEASVTCPAGAARADMERLARAALNRKLSRSVSGTSRSS
jgi:hypothetical protein